MTAGTIRDPVQTTFKPSFFFWMAVVMAVFVFGGFGMTYWKPMLTGNLYPLPPVVHVHGFFFTTWIVLLLLQTALVGMHRVALHRSLGTFGIVIATGVALSGALITLLFGSFNIADPMPDYYNLMYLGFVAVINFSVLVFLAIRNVRHPDTHRRLILFATMSILAPGINRFYMVPFGLESLPLLAMYLTVDSMIIAMLIQESLMKGRPGAVSLLGTLLLLIPQLLHAPVTGSAGFADLCAALADLTWYR